MVIFFEDSFTYLKGRVAQSEHYGHRALFLSNPRVNAVPTAGLGLIHRVPSGGQVGVRAQRLAASATALLRTSAGSKIGSGGGAGT